MFLQNFIKKNEATKINLYYSLTFSQNNYIASLQKKEALSKASVLRQLQNLINDLEQIGFEFVLDFQEECLFLTPKQQYQISSVSIVNTLFVHYLNLSSSYQFMQLFFERKDYALVDISTKLTLSNPYIYQFIPIINEKINQFHLTLTIQNKFVSLVGRESDIFMFRYLMTLALHSLSAHSTSQTIKYHNFSVDEMIQNLQLDSDQIQLDENVYLSCLFDTLIYSDIDSKKIEAEFKDSAILKLVQQLPVAKDSSVLRTFIRCCLRIFIPSLDSHSSRTQNGDKLLLSVNLPLVDLAKDMVQHVTNSFHIQQLQPNSDLFKQWFYILVIHLYAMDYFQYDFKEVYLHSKDEASTQDSVREKVITCYDSFQTDNLVWTSEKKETYRYTLVNTLYLIIESQSNTNVSIYLNFNGNIVFEKTLVYKLVSIFNESVLTFTTNSNHADLIISDYMIFSTKKDASFFLLDQSDGTKQFYQMYSLILYLLEKNQR
ncbi:hypothetical protein CKN57_05915 [Carnobacterium divergens]|uniref:helix-turn-helix domain-containing protein n=1 Tax=Carnobacterium divergens TaxID=2748 RepID=UPI001073FCF9|nr:helix-turn-helix domain-containing protein [Carnobacterium divergens]TFJ19503.1 hypothetical protein CKN57_05915 [Carnobacterium divergens]